MKRLLVKMLIQKSNQYLSLIILRSVSAIAKRGFRCVLQYVGGRESSIYLYFLSRVKISYYRQFAFEMCIKERVD